MLFYDLFAPENSKLRGNCNSSTSTILFNAGVGKAQMDVITNIVSGVKWGFGSKKAWTKGEQKEAVDDLSKQHEVEVKQADKNARNSFFYQ